ncbi:dentilisin complex serine proteinase subunit PrtP [Treponema pedis]|uniref:Dentilisin complex serine proteinase subunit PrtP n=1 Tax=Treponema pedis TaxID=409322 RepID=A0A7S6WM74_9SPIR|nr:dentilisin complex serine proteinase subunit PrtP [Treponema pedis]QOW59743.1 dentilisin complex serine proteinase subunit PrtP [Treponema pedis]
MKKILVLSAVLAILAGSCSFNIDPQNISSNEQRVQSMEALYGNSSSVLPYAPKDEDTVDGFFIVKTKAGFDKTAFEEKGFTVKGALPLTGTGFTYWYLNKEGNDKKNLSVISSVKGVISAESDYKVEPPDGIKVAKTVDGGGLADISRLINGDYSRDPIANNSDYGLSITEALKAYKEIGYGDKTVVAGIIDTGINMTHKDFKDESGNSIVLYAKSCVKSNGGTYIGNGNPFTEIPIGENWDRGAHGTHCSGTICARGDNNVGIAGVAWKNTKLISYQSLDVDGGGSAWAVYGALADLTRTVNILRKPKSDRTLDENNALPSYLKNEDFQITQKTVPVNMSLGGSYGTEFAFSVLTAAVKNNILPVIAMGNEGRYTAAYPAAFPGMLAVGATNGKDKKVHFSNKGAWISISAPGDGIKSCGISGDDDYETMSGTSMATPFVTGVISYLLSFNNAHNLTPYQIKSLLEKTADKVDGAVSFTEGYGHGRVNVYNAAKAIRENNIPQVNEIYSEGSVYVEVKNNNEVIASKISLVDEETKVPLAYVAGLGNNPVVEFKGLVKGKSYSVYASLLKYAKKETFTADGSDKTVTIQFNKNLAWVSTVPSFHYNGGNEQPDTKIIVFKADSSGNLSRSPSPILIYDKDYLDTAYFEYESGAEYYAAITGLKDEQGIFRGGNYVVKIGLTPLDLNGEDIIDGSRVASDNDTHEDDDESDKAKLKGNAWEKKYACNLAAHGTNNEDIDFFYIKTP